MMRKLGIIGATGLVGDLFLRLAAKAAFFEEIHVWVRTLPQNPLEGVEYHAFDFENDPYPFKKLGITDAFSALGTTLKKAGSKDKQWRIDHDYNLRFFSEFKAQGGQNAALISALGAKANAWFFYNKMKGSLDEKIMKLNFHHLSILRPSLILGHRKEKRRGEGMAIKFYHQFDFLIPKKFKGNKAEIIANTALKELIKGEVVNQFINAEKMH